MKKFVMAVMLLAGITGFAQEKSEVKEGGRPRKEKVTPDEQSKQLARELNLNDNQQGKIKELYTEQEKQRAAFKPTEEKKGEKHDHTAIQAKMKTENDAFNNKMKAILTPDQYTKWKTSENKQGHGKLKGKPEGEKKS